MESATDMATFEQFDDRVTVDVWSDVMCPFCYIGDTVLTQAVQSFGHPVEVRYRSFQLMPFLNAEHASDLAEVMFTQRGLSPAQTASLNAQVSERAASVGLDFHLDKAVAINTAAAHRLSHYAKAEGSQPTVITGLFRAYFTEGLNVGDYEVLADLGVDAGLDRESIIKVLESGSYAQDVDDDIAHARELGITGVPFFVFDGKYAVSGAQPAEAFLQALTAAWAAKAPGFH